MLAARFPIRRETEHRQACHGISRSSRRWISWRRVSRKLGTQHIPPKGLVLELDAGYADNSISSADEADESQKLTYVDIDTFLESF